MTINLDYWNSLDKSQQEAILKAADEIEKEQWEVVKSEDKDALDTMAQNGIKISEANETLKKELSIVADKLLLEYLADADDETKKIFEEYRR